MSAPASTRTTVDPSTNRLPVAAFAGIAIAVVLTAIGTFHDASEDDKWRRMIITVGIILVTAAIAFWAVRRVLGRDTDRVARASVVMGVLAFLSLVVFWAGPPAVLASAAAVLALAARDRRGGSLGGGQQSRWCSARSPWSSPPWQPSSADRVSDNDAVGLYRDEGVVLRTQKLGEADRIITLLTRAHGRVRAVGKGVRRTRSKFGSRLEPFTHVDVPVLRGPLPRRRAAGRDAGAYGDRIVDDYPRYTAGTVMLETAERLTAEEKEPATQQFLLLVGALRTLADAGARAEPRARRLPAALAVGRRLRPVLRGLRALHPPGPHPYVNVAGRRRGLRLVPAARLGQLRPRRPSTCSWRCSPATGRPRTRATRGRGARRVVSCRRTCSGTSSAACARCRWSNAPDGPPATADRSERHLLGEQARPGPAGDHPAELHRVEHERRAVGARTEGPTRGPGERQRGAVVDGDRPTPGRRRARARRRARR